MLVSSSSLTHADLSRDSNSQITLKPCTTAKDLDCIEWFKYKHTGKKWRDVSLISLPVGKVVDELGQEVENFVSTWSYIDENNLVRDFDVTASLSGENFTSPAHNKLYPAMWFSLWRLPTASVDSGLMIQVAIRTSWLKPQGVGVMARESSFESSRIGKGVRYTFTGAPFLSTSFSRPEDFADLNGPNQDQTKSVGEHAAFYFVVDHHSSKPDGSFWDPTCADTGFSVTSSNAIGAGQPYMSDNETLRFNIGAPHRLSTGEMNRGFFSTDIHTAYIDCRWPNNILTRSPRIEVSVVNEDGSNQVATTSVIIDRGILKVRATGFHYSSPTITLKASQNLDLPSLKPTNQKLGLIGSKAKPLTCTRGNQVQKLQGTKNCPKGWTKSQ